MQETRALILIEMDGSSMAAAKSSAWKSELRCRGGSSEAQLREDPG